mgnify:CR=1 FL=1
MLPQSVMNTATVPRTAPAARPEAGMAWCALLQGGIEAYHVNFTVPGTKRPQPGTRDRRAAR